MTSIVLKRMAKYTRIIRSYAWRVMELSTEVIEALQIRFPPNFKVDLTIQIVFPVNSRPTKFFSVARSIKTPPARDLVRGSRRAFLPRLASLPTLSARP